MNDAPTRTATFEARLKKRYAAERRFRLAGLSAILFSVAVLVFLLVTMTWNGIGGFQRAELRVAVDFREMGLSLPPGSPDQAVSVRALEVQGLADVVQFGAEQSLGKDGATQLSPDAWRVVAERAVADPALLLARSEFWLPAKEGLAAALAGEGRPALQPLSQRLVAEDKLAERFDLGFLTRSDATDSQQVGIWAALKGSILTMLVTLALAFPVGVLTAAYLEEYAPRNRWTELIEVSINNLAAVPSIIFGLLGLAVFLTLFPSMRSAPLIGGMTLALMTMPVIVISGRNAIKAVPPSIRDGAMALGASPVQVVFHHVVP